MHTGNLPEDYIWFMMDDATMTGLQWVVIALILFGYIRASVGRWKVSVAVLTFSIGCIHEVVQSEPLRSNIATALFECMDRAKPFAMVANLVFPMYPHAYNPTKNGMLQQIWNQYTYGHTQAVPSSLLDVIPQYWARYKAIHGYTMFDGLSLDLMMSALSVYILSQHILEYMKNNGPATVHENTKNQVTSTPPNPELLRALKTLANQNPESVDLIREAVMKVMTSMRHSDEKDDRSSDDSEVLVPPDDAFQ
mmetsp:Transcript_1800/g.5761  ORF Transcript_1800/g.5761 Transcript_1800/m.5761 type:complete len:251 (-) Transcript_1800:22-774(-)